MSDPTLLAIDIARAVQFQLGMGDVDVSREPALQSFRTKMIANTVQRVLDAQKAQPPCGADVAVPAGYRLQPLSEYEAMRYALDMPDGDFPKWKELVIADLQTSYDSDGITHEDSGDPLIYLQSAIAIVEDMLLPGEPLASQPAAPVAPATVAVPDDVAKDECCNKPVIGRHGYYECCNGVNRSAVEPTTSILAASQREGGGT